MNHPRHTTIGTAAVLAGLSIAAAAAGRDAVEWRLEDGGNGHWYDGIRSEQPLTWFEARDLAESMGGHLVSVRSMSEYDVVHEIAGRVELWNGRVGPWLGGYQDRTGGDVNSDGIVDAVDLATVLFFWGDCP